MEEPVSSTESVNPEYDLLILHTAEAQEWAAYLQQILKSSKKFQHGSILLYAVSTDDQLHGYNFEYFQSCKCIVLLVSGVLVDILCDHDLQEALQKLLHPPHRVVVLLCGVPEDDMLVEAFTDWPSWRKLYAEDEPTVYISTIWEAINESWRLEAEKQNSDVPIAAKEEEEKEVVVEEQEEKEDEGFRVAAASLLEDITSKVTEEVVSEVQEDPVLKDEEKPTRSTMENSTSEGLASPTHSSCLTVQPSRVLCGEPETLFIILSHKIDDQIIPEVEFSSENITAIRVPATVENQYTISVTTPDMPAGLISLTMYTDQSRVTLKPVTFSTRMAEVSRYLEKASDPVNFICQAFNFTSSATDSVDTILTDSLKSSMPETGLQLFGIRQIEEDNMSAYQRDQELPTLLHFAAKFGLKKLTTILLQCPGALQAYSVMNKHGDYPNRLAEKNGFSDLRQFMDEFVQTTDMLKLHIEDNMNTDDTAEIYEMMSDTSQDIMKKYSGCTEDIYESMLGIDPQCAEDLYEVMTAVDENPEEAMLRKFFQSKQNSIDVPENNNNTPPPKREEREEEKDDQKNFDDIEVEEDPYNLCPEDIYDTVDDNSTYKAAILNRPPAPIPRPESMCEAEKPATYISRVFSDKEMSQSKTMDTRYPAARPVVEPPTPAHDPYAGMKTPGQRQLVSLQERVKVGEITVDEAVQEFKAWQFDHERRANSIRYQQDNLKKLRDSITRRHKEREKSGKELDYEISAPLQRSLYWGSTVSLECAVYESAPRMSAPPPPPAQVIQRGNWKTGSTSSTSSTESNRLSTHSTFSFSSGTEPDFEEALENLPPPPPRPPRTSDPAPPITSFPPRIPPRIPERVPEMVHERYISCPTRALPQRPSYRQTDVAPPPPIPRRLR